MMRVLPLLCALLLGVGTALLVGCGSSRGNLLPPRDAQALKAQLQAVQQATAGRRCSSSQAALARARATVKSLPSSVDAALVTRLQSGLDRLRARADQECAAPAPVTTTTIPTTTTPLQPPPTTTTQAPPPTTASTDSAPSTPTTPTTPTTAPGAGGGATPGPPTTSTTPAPDGGASPGGPGTGG